MKRILLASWLLALFGRCLGQNWEPLGGGASGGPVETLAVDTFHHYLWVGGGFDSVGDIHALDLAAWNGTKWKNVDVDPGYVSALAMKGDTLFCASGNFVWGDQQMYVYVDTTFIESFQSGYINCLYVYHDTLFAGDDYGYIKFWDGNDWYEYHGGVSGPYAEVHAITEYNGELVIAGNFDHASGVFGNVNNIVAWNGSQWHKLGDGVVSSTFPVIYALQEYNEELYVGGNFDSAGGIYCGGIAKWDGNAWSTVTLSNTGYGCGAVRSFYNDGQYLYAAGDITGYDDCIGDLATMFDGQYWYNLHLSHSGHGFAISTFNGDIIEGTDFAKTSSSDTINYIGHYIGSIPTSIATANEFSSTPIFPNPTTHIIQLHLPSSPTTISIFNLLGEKVKEQKVTTQEVTIDVSELPAGMYVVRTEKEMVGKFVKE